MTYIINYRVCIETPFNHHLLAMLFKKYWNGPKESFSFLSFLMMFQYFSKFCFNSFCIQVELVLTQFRRAKGRVDAPDVELHEDLLSLYNKSNDAETDPAVLRRLADKLQLMGIVDLTQESLALHEMVDASGGDPGESIEKMSMLLKKIKDFVQTENPNIEASAGEKGNPPSCSGQVSSDKNSKAPVIPVDFRCPISLELMKDPVIVSTGQVYAPWACSLTAKSGCKVGYK